MENTGTVNFFVETGTGYWDARSVIVDGVGKSHWKATTHVFTRKKYCCNLSKIPQNGIMSPLKMPRSELSFPFSSFKKNAGILKGLRQNVTYFYPWMQTCKLQWSHCRWVCSCPRTSRWRGPCHPAACTSREARGIGRIRCTKTSNAGSSQKTSLRTNLELRHKIKYRVEIRRINFLTPQHYITRTYVPVG